MTVTTWYMVVAATPAKLLPGWNSNLKTFTIIHHIFFCFNMVKKHFFLLYETEFIFFLSSLLVVLVVPGADALAAQQLALLVVLAMNVDLVVVIDHALGAVLLQVAEGGVHAPGLLDERRQQVDGARRRILGGEGGAFGDGVVGRRQLTVN
jgi:hypothetical protein